MERTAPLPLGLQPRFASVKGAAVTPSAAAVPVVVAQRGASLALYLPATGDAAIFDTAEAAAAASTWLNGKRDGKKLAIIAADPVAESAPSWAQLRGVGVASNESAWTIAHGMLAHHSRNIAGFRAPTSLEDAYHMMHKKVFDGRDDIRIAANGASPAELQRDGPLRDAVLAWETIHELHKRFGLPGMKKPLPPLEQIVQRIVRTVNIFAVQLVSNVGGHAKMADAAKGKYAVEVFSVSKGTVTSVDVENFEQTKVKSLIDTLFVPSTISVFVPTSKTSDAQLLNFVRHCGPKCPFFVCRPSELNVSSTAAATDDPRQLWDSLASELGSPDAAVSAVEMWATAKAALRATKPRVAPQRADDRERLLKAPASAAAASSSPSSFIAGSQSDPEVFLALKQWHKTIYENPSRKEAEEKAAGGLTRYLVLDLETTTTKRYKRIANPFTNENYIVLPGLLDHTGTVNIPDRHLTRETPFRLPPLDQYDVIVGHNLKFDLLHLWRDPELKRFFQRGGKIWDTMYAEYLLTGHRVKLGSGAGLEDVAKSRGGKIPKLDEVKQAWAEGKQTFEIPHATLKKYLMGDLLNTEMIFKQQIKEAVEQRQVLIVNARMDGLLCTTEMEFNGLKIDVKVAESQKMELEKEIATLTRSMAAHVPQVIPPHLRMNFNWQSNKDLGALFFGGAVTYETHARESKTLPARDFARQDIGAGDTALRMISPPRNPLPAAYCTILSGNIYADKATKLHRTYFTPLLHEMAIRSSAELEELAQARVRVVGLPHDSLPFATALQFTLVPVLCGVSIGPSGEILSAELRSVMDGSHVSYAAGDAATAVKAFLEDQVARHTKPLESVDGRVTMQPPTVLLLCRDAAFDVGVKLAADPVLRDAFEGRLTSTSMRPTSDGSTSFAPFAIQLVDTTAISEYVAKTRAAAAATSKKGGSSKKSASPKERYNAEAALLPSAWCDAMQARLSEFADAALANESVNGEAADSKPAAAKLTKRQKDKASMKPQEDSSEGDESGSGATSTAPRRASSAMIDVLAQNVGGMQARWGLSDADMLRFKIARIAGMTATTAYDAFVHGSNESKEVTFTLPGVINGLGLNEAEKLAALEKFRSALTKQPAVNDESLKFFTARKVEVSAALHKLRKMSKLMGTYFEDNGTGMVSLVHETDSCIHHELIHNKTNTGRLASANPNCQNLPKEDKSDLREMFVSRFPDGKCIEADYSQLEVITLCALANDKQMIADLESKVDFHCKRVTMMRPDLTYDEVLQRAKINKEPEFVKLRQQAKIFSFQRQYGAGVRTISESTGLSPDDVKKLIDNERLVYADIDRFTQMVTLSAQIFDGKLQDGARNASGDIRFKGMFPVITGSRYVFTEHDVPSSMLKAGAKTTAFSPTHIKNYPVQGFAGEIVQIMLGRLWRKFVSTENYGGAALLTNTVHDCVWVDAKSEVSRQVAQDVARIMSSARDALNETWPEMQCRVEFPVDVVVGANMCHLAPLPKA